MANHMQEIVRHEARCHLLVKMPQGTFELVENSTVPQFWCTFDEAAIYEYVSRASDITIININTFHISFLLLQEFQNKKFYYITPPRHGGLGERVGEGWRYFYFYELIQQVSFGFLLGPYFHSTAYSESSVLLC